MSKPQTKEPIKHQAKKPAYLKEKQQINQTQNNTNKPNINQQNQPKQTSSQYKHVAKPPKIFFSTNSFNK